MGGMKGTESVETRIRRPGLRFHLCYTHNQAANSLSLRFYFCQIEIIFSTQSVKHFQFLKGYGS